jgi:hypothetical protein
MMLKYGVNNFSTTLNGIDYYMPFDQNSYNDMFIYHKPSSSSSKYIQTK